MNDVRIQLAAARAALRTAEDQFRLVQATAERDIIVAAGTDGIGSNKEDRERTLTIRLAEHTVFVQARDRVRAEQERVDRLQAEVEIAIDARKVLDRASRDRQSAALERLGSDIDEVVDTALQARAKRRAA